jgi:quercetin dioxygenase-like cupin family protein
MGNIQESFKAQAGYFPLDEVKAVELANGVQLKLVSGEKAMMSFVTLEPGSVVPLHSHPHEQLGTMLEGELTLYMGSLNPEDGRLIRKGDTYVIPGGVLHGARATGSTPCVALDVFSPIREDYVEKFQVQHGHVVAGHAESKEG